MKEAINNHISSKKKIDTVNKTEKSQASNKTVDKPRSNKPEKLNQWIYQGMIKELTHKTQ